MRGTVLYRASSSYSNPTVLFYSLSSLPRVTGCSYSNPTVLFYSLSSLPRVTGCATHYVSCCSNIYGPWDEAVVQSYVGEYEELEKRSTAE